MKFEAKVEQWRQLKKSKKALEKRIKQLRQEILNELPLQQSSYGVTIEERNKTTYDEDRVYDLMVAREVPLHLWTRTVVDESKLEQLYYEDVLSDADLRYIRKPNYIYALVERGAEDVQGKHDCDSSGIRPEVIHDSSSS